MKNQILLNGDLFNISSRLKQVDKSYFIVFNNSRKRYEVHSSSQRGQTYAFTVPYDTLDERTIFYARKTRRQNIDALIREMDEENERLQQGLVKNAIEQIKEVK